VTANPSPLAATDNRFFVFDDKSSNTTPQPGDGCADGDGKCYFGGQHAVVEKLEHQPRISNWRAEQQAQIEIDTTATQKIWHTQRALR
jgi:hypothetical protein